MRGCNFPNMDTYAKRFCRLEKVAMKMGEEAHIKFLLDSAPSLTAYQEGNYGVPLPNTEQSEVSAAEKKWSTGRCKHCCSDEGLVKCDEEGDYVCILCGHCEPVLENTLATAAYGTVVNCPPCVYKRTNHFRDWLLQSNGDEPTLVPHAIIEAVEAEAKKDRRGADLTAQDVRGILKKLKKPKHYENAQQICNKIVGTHARKMTPAQMEKLQTMFVAVQHPFDKAVALHCPKRKNFLSYSYVLHKFCQLVNLDEFIDRFPLLRSRDKLKQQDVLWQSMCNTLRWEFIPSI